MFSFKPKTKCFGQHFLYFSNINSTNDYLMNHYDGHLQEGLVIFSEYQNKGKGQRKHTWQSKKATSLLFSLLLKPKQNKNQIHQANQIAALAISKSIEQYCKLKTQIKWPNDLYLQNKKCSGILSQTFQKQNQWLILGIGLNVNQSKLDFKNATLPNATSLQIESGIVWNRKLLLQVVLLQLEYYYYKWQKEDFSYFIPDLNAKLSHKNQQVQIKQKQKSFSGKIAGLNHQGYLILKTKQGLKIIQTGSLC